MTQLSYEGSELDVFSNAINWKRYVCARLRQYLRGEVLEVGAGIGSVTKIFRSGEQRRWVCLEPDPELSCRAQEEELKGVTGCEFVVGTVEDLKDDRFDAILYMDVLEHISDDCSELARAALLLRPCGVICVLAPAHQWLFTRFDASIGHFRRYDKASLAALGPAELKLERLEYLDCCGLLASLGNRLFLKSGSPTEKQIIFWDRILVSCSRMLDPLVAHRLGKSVLAVWRRA